MTLTILDQLEQGSDAWLEARRGIVTASVVGQLITAKTLKPAANDYSRALTAQLVAERITGWTEPTYVNNDMMRGTLDEPIARDLYTKHFAPVTEVGFMTRTFAAAGVDYKIGFSPDGLVGDDGLIEIKSRRPKAQVQTVLGGQVPAANMAQIQCGLLVSDRAWCDYVSFASGMALYTVRVEPDPKWFTAIVEAVELFEQTAAAMVADYQYITRDLPLTERIDHFEEMTLA